MIKIIKFNKNKLMEDSISKEDSKTDNTKNSKELNTKIQTSKINDKSPTKNGSKKDDEDDDFVLPVKTIKRSNSIKLYKKHQKDKAKKLNVRKDSKKNIKGGDIFDGAEEDGTKRPNKSTKNVGQKKVVFPPNFVTIIDVESYKKFNEENTCKDPFENMEIINGRININNYDEESDGKARVLCSCLIC